MNIIAKKFTEHKMVATIALIGVAVVLSTGVGFACKGYVDNQAKIKKQAVENQQKLEAEKIAKQKNADEAQAKAKAAEEAAKTVEVPKSVADPATVASTKSVVTTNKPKTKTESKPAPDSGEVISISLASAGGSLVKWQAKGISDKGFKVVWSKVSGPTYPNRATDRYHYLSDPASYKDYVSAFDGPGTYFVRVCEYLGGACGVYSNQISVSL